MAYDEKDMLLGKEENLIQMRLEQGFGSLIWSEYMGSQQSLSHDLELSKNWIKWRTKE